MKTKLRIKLLMALCATMFCLAQPDSTVVSFRNLPLKYFITGKNKTGKYSSRLTGKPGNTLAKFSKWENKIKDILVQLSPETSTKTFGPLTA